NMEDIDALLADYSDTVTAITRRLREIVVSIMPDANEVVTGHKNISYHTDAGQMKGGMVYIAPFKDSVNLGFMDGIDLDDPQTLLGGSGKRLRHVKLQTVEAVEEMEPHLRNLLEQAKALKA
ncbi:MAG: DUF1801 domain-containing protein, partial [Chloroflexi bacterium]|nr:DUF1801 domain-containing protein [Chloroflexota bacterium]